MDLLCHILSMYVALVSMAFTALPENSSGIASKYPGDKGI